jgi:cell division protein FtsZ
MSNELRVTVVATGIGERKADISLVTPSKVAYEPVAQNTVHTQVGSAALDLESRVAPAASAAPAAQASASAQQSLDYLDVPAFLRKQAD